MICSMRVSFSTVFQFHVSFRSRLFFNPLSLSPSLIFFLSSFLPLLFSLCFSSQGYSWIKVAQALNTNRTPLQCIAQFQRHCNPSMGKEAWTPAEEHHLRALVAQVCVRFRIKQQNSVNL
jgi:hypothetical protein